MLTLLEIRLLALRRERLVDSRTRPISELRWQLHDLWPDWQIARDMIKPNPRGDRTITQLYEQLAGLLKQVAPHMPAEKGLGVLIAAKLVGESPG